MVVFKHGDVNCEADITALDPSSAVRSNLADQLCTEEREQLLRQKQEIFVSPI